MATMKPSIDFFSFLHVLCRSHSFIDGQLKDARNMMGLIIMTLSPSSFWKYVREKKKKKGKKSGLARNLGEPQAANLLSC